MCLSIKVDHPDCVLAEGEHAGFEFVVTHNRMGYRCGYVRVPKGHPWHGKEFHEIDAEVHGGLTFSEPDKPCNKGGADDAHWLGFDCAHSWDAQDPALPSEHHMPSFGPASVRTQEYVEAECRSLCEQAARAVTV
jgi:hypothetical protein